MTIFVPVELQGVQQPRLKHLPAEITSTAGREAVELAASAGLVLDPWQQHVLDVALSERPDPHHPGELRWSAMEVALVCPRQNGKGSVLEARELAGLVLFGEQLILHSAHEFKTAGEAFIRIQHLIENCDDLRRQVLRVARANGEQGIELRNGSRLRFIARSKGSGRGFSGDLVILDEAYELGAQAIGALLPTLSARPNPQLWYASSAPMSTSEQLHKVRERALAGRGDSLAYFEWSAADNDDPDDIGTWARANPSLGYRLFADRIAIERESMPDSEFRRERLGIPDMPAVLGGSADIDGDAWAALADPGSVPVGRVGFVVDVSPNGRSACVVMAGWRADGLLHLEIVDHRQGTDWVVSRRSELEARFPHSLWALDPSGPAVQLRSLGDWTEFGTKDSGEAFAGFLASIDAGDLRWRCADVDYDAMWAAMSGARRSVYGDGVSRWSRRNSQIDICPLVALTLGFHVGRRLRNETVDPLMAVW